MNNDIDPDTDVRVAAALRAIAESHEPMAAPIARPRLRRSWLLTAAAAAVIVVGVGALALATGRNTQQPSSSLPLTQPSTTPAPPTTTILPLRVEIADVFSDTPLGPDAVPIVDPAPGRAAGFDFARSARGWASGVENSASFAVLDGRTVVHLVMVFDTPAPWDALAEDEDVQMIGGRRTVVVDEEFERGVFVETAMGVRAAFTDGSDIDQNLPVAELVEVLTQLGDTPIDSFVDTDRLVKVPVEQFGSRAVTYGEDQSVELTLLRLDRELSADGTDIIGQVFRRTSDGDDLRPRSIMQLSPLDVVVIVAQTEAALDDAKTHLDVVSIDASGIDFHRSPSTAGLDSIRGEPAWGRWEVSTNPSDADCRYFEVQIWSVRGTGRGFDDCGTLNSVRPGGARIFCAKFDLETVVVVVGSSTEPDLSIGPDIEGLAIEVERAGTSSSMRVVQTEPGANVRGATVFVDDIEVNCDG